MYRSRYVVVLVVVGLAVGATTAVSANTTDWDLDTSAQTVTFEPGDSDSLEHTVEVTNNDQNNSVSISASIGGGHSVVSQPGQLAPGESGDIVVELRSGGSANPTLEVSGGGKTETVDYTVETPAYVEITDVPDWLDEEGVLRGDSRTATVTVEEVGGYSGFDGISVGGDTAGLDLSDLEQASVTAGGSTTVEVVFSADDNANQHEDIGGTLRLDPNDGVTDETDQTLESFVAYPAEFGSVSLYEGRITFDEPRSNGEITKSGTIEVENSGDRELDFRTVRFDSMPFDVEILDRPDTIAPTSIASVDVAITASTDLDEGEYAFGGTVDADDTSVADASLDDSLIVEHGIQLDVSPSQVGAGDIPIGNTGTTGLTVSEALGYRDIDSVDMELTDGQSEWITVTSSPPRAIAAGTSQPVRFEVEFPPAADIGTTYTWTFQLQGEDVETQEIIVSATAIPLNLDPIREELESTATGNGALNRTGEQTRAMVTGVDQRIRSGDIPRQDVTRVLTFSDSVVQYIEAITAAETAIENGENDAANAELVRAAVAFDTMRTYGEAIQDDRLRNQSATVRETAGPELERLLTDQERHYQQRLSGEDTSPLQEATVKRELARIAALRGDTDRADRLEEEAESAFARYRDRVAEGEQKRQNASQIWTRMEQGIFVTVVGQPLVLNPLQYDEFQDRSEAVLTAYDASETAFSAAGETTRAETVADERAERAGQITVARYSLFAVSGLTLVLIVLLTVHTARGMYWYVQDSEASITGDFLV